jgi:hypothetical protein
MRISALLLGASLVCGASAIASAADLLPYVVGPQIPGLPPNAVIVGEYFRSVSLQSTDALARLKESNAADYAIAIRIRSAAGEFCSQDAAKPRVAGLKSQDVVCSATMYSSNPPKRLVWFKVNHILYSMLVTLPT